MEQVSYITVVSWLIAITALAFNFLIFFFERKEIIRGLKNKDKMWQFLELASITWLIFFSVVCTQFLLGQKIELAFLGFLELVFLTIVGGKAYINRTSLEDRKNDKGYKVDNTDSNSSPIE